MISGQTQAAPYPAVTRLRPPEDLDSRGAEAEDDGVSRELEEVTLAAVKAAQDCRFRLLDDVTVNFGARDGAALSVQVAVPADIAGESEDRLHELEEDRGEPEAEPELSAPAEAIERYQAKAVELMNANVNVTLDYARRLAEVRSPAEFIAVSARHACRHFDLIMTHATALGVLSQSLVRTGREPKRRSKQRPALAQASNLEDAGGVVRVMLAHGRQI